MVPPGAGQVYVKHSVSAGHLIGGKFTHVPIPSHRLCCWHAPVASRQMTPDSLGESPASQIAVLPDNLQIDWVNIHSLTVTGSEQAAPIGIT